MEHQGPGLLACDEELFARVWDRVSAGESCPIVPQAPPAPVPLPAPSAPVTQPVDPTAAALQQWVTLLLSDAAAYAALRRQGGQGRAVLAGLEREKRQGARTLAAEYFLRSGVRYWPQQPLPTARPCPFLPALAAFYRLERSREAALRRQAAQEEPELAQRYLALSEAARSAAHRLRELLETVW